ncbi:NAD-dependent epimerase/dehydratase family protein [Streptomyces otsuchiensis]|uniref:NAD-dependent epimerase/dehydratase family protein n=1 Tax=Streptomyces otsuchiensis TaxID=2681388 RepID=UPI001032195E|nr:NAD-dependent epimerase/dehydratase family protein [Streptomyces otsuchiensis]
MRVLVTGGAGFVGSHLVDRLLVEGHRVSVVDDLSTGLPENLDRARSLGLAEADLHVLDIAGEAAADVIRSARPEVVVHLAAQPSVAVSMRDPLLDAHSNITGLLRVLTAARDAGSRKVVFASSGGTIYGEPDPETLPLAEEAPLAPRSFYGLSKKYGAECVRLFAEEYGLAHASLALGNVYGPRQNPQGEAGVIAIFAQRLLAGRPCVVFGDGLNTRDYVYVDDVADAFVRALDRGTGLINIGTGVETSVLDIHAALARDTGTTAAPVHEPALAGEVRRISLGVGRAADQLGWRPATPLADGVPKVVSWLRESDRS